MNERRNHNGNFRTSTGGADIPAASFGRVLSPDRSALVAQALTIPEEKAAQLLAELNT